MVIYGTPCSVCTARVIFDSLVLLQLGGDVYIHTLLQLPNDRSKLAPYSNLKPLYKLFKVTIRYSL